MLGNDRVALALNDSVFLHYDMKFKIAPRCILDMVENKRKRKECWGGGSTCTGDKKETQTSLLSTSAACSEESAGCQTLKGTEAEFNASCQGMLM